ncbi:MAG: PKD domain-containing protein [Chitinophagaceae bacterium]
MKLLTIFILLTCAAGYGQSVRLPSGDSITYDFSGATRKGSPGLYKYFTTSTSDDGRIIRNVADFNKDSLGGKGWRGMINFQAEYNLDSIKFYDRSGSVDTIWIFTFDRNNAPKWDTICNPEDYTPDYLITTCGTCAGLPVTTKINAKAGDKVQFAFVVMRRTNLFSGLWPNVSQISFYGSPTGLADTTYNLAHWAVQKWTPRKIGDIVGHFNLQNQQDTAWSDTSFVNNPGDSSFARTFDQMYQDDENKPNGMQRINMGGYGFTSFKYNAAMARRKHFQFAAIFNDNAYFKAQLIAAGHTVSKGWGTNTITDDPQLSSSYSRKGYYMGIQALIGGPCADSPRNNVRTYNGDSTAGKGFLKILGVNNEPTLFAFPNAFKNAIECAAEVDGVYDSVKRRCPKVLVFASGFEAYNYDDAKAMVMALKLKKRSRNIPLDGIDFHGIHTLKSDSFPYIPTTNQQIGNYGVSPGYWNDWRKNIHFVNGMARETGNPTIKVSLTEDTYQKGYYKRYPVNAGETFSVSQLAAPAYTVGGSALSRLLSHGVGATQLEFIASASGLYQHYWYAAVDEIDISNNPGYDAIDGNNGKFDRPINFNDKPQSWPADYYTNSRKLRLANYKFVDSVVTQFRGLHVFKYQHINNPDSVMYEFAILDSVGTVAYQLTGLNNTIGKLITPSATSRRATETPIIIAGGAYTLSADPLPKAIIVFNLNLAPVANAGADQTITLPTSSVTLNGSASTDVDGTITAYAWTKISGPGGSGITNPSSAITTVTGLKQGTYVFRLRVTDNDGATGTDDVRVVVNK